jgi:adenine/guanine phosphoribosyltransferase-like PRPP-binding protein
MTKYTPRDTNPMSRDEFGKVLGNLIKKIDAYQRKYHTEFDIIVPILRSGMIPATVIANHFKITKILPIQVKYLHDGLPSRGNPTQMLSLANLLQHVPTSPNILICETNTGKGGSAKKVIDLIREQYPDSVLYYATVAKVYGGPDRLDHIKKYFYGIRTDEFFKASDEQAKKLSLRPKITIFPWETTEYEL